MFFNMFILWYVLLGFFDLKKCWNLKWIVDIIIVYLWGEVFNGLYFIFFRGKFLLICVYYWVFDIKSVFWDEEGFKNWMYDRYIEKEVMLECFYKIGFFVDNFIEFIDIDVKGVFFFVVMVVCFSVFLYFFVILLVNFKWILLIVLIYIIYFVYSFVKIFFWWINVVDIIFIFVVLFVEFFWCIGLW